MKKIVLFCFMAFVCLRADDLGFYGELAGKIDRKPYSYEKKIKIMKRIGMEYCIRKNDDFYKTQPYYMIMGRYEYKMSLGNGTIEKKILPELKPYIDDRATINNKTRGKHYKNSNFSRFYTCLELYDSKEYQQEIERILKKYCGNCKWNFYF